MNILLYIICFLLFLLILAAIFKIIALKNIIYKEPEILSDKKILIVYYSNGGNTRNVAENLRSITGGELKEIRLSKSYPNNIFEMSKLVRKQMKEGNLPEIENVDISDYDVIFVGFPIWNFSVSLPMKVFLKNNNFENKILVPFFTCSGGGNRKKVINEIKDYANAKEIKPPLFMFENGIFLIKERIIKWLNQI